MQSLLLPLPGGRGPPEGLLPRPGDRRDHQGDPGVGLLREQVPGQVRGGLLLGLMNLFY